MAVGLGQFGEQLGHGFGGERGELGAVGHQHLLDAGELCGRGSDGGEALPCDQQVDRTELFGGGGGFSPRRRTFSVRTSGGKESGILISALGTSSLPDRVIALPRAWPVSLRSPVSNAVIMSLAMGRALRRPMPSEATIGNSRNLSLIKN